VARRTGRIEVSAYLTPEQARDLDEYCKKEGGISRSAALRALGIKQLRYARWQERLKVRGRNPSPRAGPIASRPAEVGRYLLDVRPEEIYETAIAAVRRDPDQIDRILAARTMKLLNLAQAEFNPRRNAEVQPFVRDARRAIQEPE